MTDRQTDRQTGRNEIFEINDDTCMPVIVLLAELLLLLVELELVL